MNTLNKVFVGIGCAFLMVALCVVSIASTYDIKEMTPEIKSALDSRRERFEQLQSLKASGVVGETNKGYVQSLQSDSAAEALVAAENKDRQLIYKTIVSQNDLPKDALSTVETVFAQVQHSKSPAGSRIQNDAGDWVSKE